MDHQQTWFDTNAGWVGFAGLVFGVLGPVTGFIFYWLSRRPKILGWQLMSTNRIVTMPVHGFPITISYTRPDNSVSEIKQPNLVVVRIGNRGKIEIRREDFDKAISIKFTKSKLLGAAASTPLPDIALPKDVPIKGNVAYYRPPLLQLGEWFEIQLLTDGDLEVPEFHARVAGQEKSYQELQKQRSPWDWIAVGATIVGMILFFSVGFVPANFQAIPAFLFMASLGLGAIAMKRSEKRPTWANEPKQPDEVDRENGNKKKGRRRTTK